MSDRVISLTKGIGATDAGAYDVSGLRRHIRVSRIVTYLSVGLGVFVACGLSYQRALALYDDQARRFRQAAISIELESAPTDENELNARQLRLRLAQERDENRRLRETIAEIGAVIVDIGRS